MKKTQMIGLVICILLIVIGLTGAVYSLTAKNKTVADTSNVEDVYKAIYKQTFPSPMDSIPENLKNPVTAIMMLMVFAGVVGIFYIYTYQIKKQAPSEKTEREQKSQ
jgi:Na+/proline symporter